MRTDQGLVIQRSDYRPWPFAIDRVALAFDLDPAATRVTTEARVRRVGAPDAALELAGDGPTLLEVRIDGRPLAPDAFTCDASLLRIARVPDTFTLTVVTRIDPSANTTLMGLYVSNGNYFTQCEAEGFRRITFFPDRPDVMTRYTVTIRADEAACPVLLSNGNLVAQGDCDDRPGWHWARWEDPFPKPSYLFALVAGRFAAREERIKTGSGRDALLQVWVEPGNEDKTGHAMQSLIHAIRWDEQRFGLELDLERFMIVAVGDFNMGAMENKGLNIFNTKYVFANPRIATDADFANIEAVVGHEYFHNWTGNRVTCRDWFQLTLKEGLTVFRDQEFSADMLAASAADEAAARSARAVKRIEDVRTLRSVQFPEDAGPMAHPIRPDSYQEINNFYTVTVYEKGAEVIRMLQTLVGRDGFRKGIDLYFARHDGQAVTCDDFVAAIADANQRDLTVFGRWYSQAGTPQLRIDGHYDAAARRYRLDVRQTCAPSPGQPAKLPFHVPLAVGLIGPDGRDLLPATRVLDLTQAEQQFVFDGIDEEPVPSLLRDFSAPVVVEYPYTTAQLAFLAAHDSDPFNRWEAIQRLATDCVLRVLAGAELPAQAGALVDVLRATIEDESLDPAYREQMLILPTEGFTAEQLPVVDPAAVRQARNALRRHIGQRLLELWRGLHARLAPTGPYSPDPVQAGRRGLRNAALGFWIDSGDPAAQAAALAQYRAADNMTDRLAAMQGLVNSPSADRELVLADFAVTFADEPLAMDKWFMLQAAAHRQPGDAPVLARVRTLLEHPAFSIRNPNKVRALIGSFCNGNLAEFHAADGSGYAFWREQVLRLDPINPQEAARLARALDRWRKFTPDRRQAMKAAIEQVAAAPGLSADVAEIVTKALAS
ncbi:MAG: aminopeptidase N [Burkholderiaceae bacterium]